MAAFAFVGLLVGIASLLLPSSARRRGSVLFAMVIATALAIALLTAVGIARSVHHLPDSRSTLMAKCIGGFALVLVPLFRWRSLARALPSVLTNATDGRRLPFSFRFGAKQRGRGAKHYGNIRIVGRVTVIETVLLVMALIVAVVLMVQ